MTPVSPHSVSPHGAAGQQKQPPPPRALSLARLVAPLGALVASSLPSRTSFAYARGFDAMNALTRRNSQSPSTMSSLPIHRASSSSSVVENSFELKFIFPSPGQKAFVPRFASRVPRLASRRARASSRHAPRASLTLAISLDVDSPPFSSRARRMRARVRRMNARENAREEGANAMNALERGRRRRASSRRRDRNPTP